MDESIANNNTLDGNEDDGDLPIAMVPCPDCFNLVPATNLELHRLRACPSNGDNTISGSYGDRRRESATLVTTTNLAPTANTSATDEDDDSVVVVMTTLSDSPSQRPRKTRRGDNVNDTISNQTIDEGEIIDVMDESDIALDPLSSEHASHSASASASARAIDLTATGEEEEDRKLPARDTTAGSDSSDDNLHQSEDEWSCPRCTLLNNNSSPRCNACSYFNSEIQIRLNRNASMGQEHSNRNTTTESSSQPYRHRPWPNSAPSSLSYIGSGALFGAAVGMAGNWVQGRSPLSGAFEGGTTGAMGGALLHEVLQNSNNNSNNRNAQTATPSAQAETAAFLRRDRNAADTQLNSRSNNNNRMPAQSSLATGIAEYPTADARYESMNSSAGRLYRLRPRVNNNGDRSGDALMDLILHHQLSMQGNRDRTSFGGFERDAYSDYSNHRVFRQLQAMQFRREWNTNSNNFENGIDAMNYDQLLNAFGDGTENMGADEGEIRRLPTHVVGENPLPEDARQCLICLEDFEKGDSRTILPCLHGFHKNCCHKWLSTNGKCPVCKHPISSNG